MLVFEACSQMQKRSAQPRPALTSATPVPGDAFTTQRAVARERRHRDVHRVAGPRCVVLGPRVPRRRRASARTIRRGPRTRHGQRPAAARRFGLQSGAMLQLSRERRCVPPTAATLARAMMTIAASLWRVLPCSTVRTADRCDSRARDDDYRGFALESAAMLQLSRARPCVPPTAATLARAMMTIAASLWRVLPCCNSRASDGAYRGFALQNARPRCHHWWKTEPTAPAEPGFPQC